MKKDVLGRWSFAENWDGLGKTRRVLWDPAWVRAEERENSASSWTEKRNCCKALGK